MGQANEVQDNKSTDRSPSSPDNVFQFGPYTYFGNLREPLCP